LCSAVLAADKTWLTDWRFDFVATDWWSNITPVEMPSADTAVAPAPANLRAPELSMEGLLHGLLFSKPSASWRLAFEKTEITSAWMAQQSGGGSSSLQGADYLQPAFFSVSSATTNGFAAPTSPTAINATGTWALNASGNWSNSANWAGGTIADGAGNTADFSSFDLTNNIVVNLDSSRTIGNLLVGDFNGTNTYTLSSSSGATLTFDLNTGRYFDESLLQQSSTSAGDTIAVPLLLNNSLDINNLSATKPFTITGNIAGSSGTNTFPSLTFNGQDTSTSAAGNILVSGNISNGNTGARLGVSVRAGTVTFSGTNTYTGSTSIAGGTLLINGDNSAATGNVSVFNSGTLGGTGTVGGNVITFDGTITGATAGTVGTLTLKGNVELSSGEGSGTYWADLSGSLSDLLKITGTLGLGVDSILDIHGVGDGVTTYTLATFDSRTDVFGSVMGIPSGYSLVYSATDIELVPTAIPEPATWIGGALALGAIGFISRRARRRRA